MVIHYSAIIGHDGDEKYVVARIKSGESDTVKLTVVSLPLKYHAMIAAELDTQLQEGETLEILGGGILKIDRAARTVFTYGQSGGYGRPKKTMVETILQNAPELSGFTSTVTVTSYIRD